MNETISLPIVDVSGGKSLSPEQIDEIHSGLVLKADIPHHRSTDYEISQEECEVHDELGDVMRRARTRLPETVLARVFGVTASARIESEFQGEEGTVILATGKARKGYAPGHQSVEGNRGARIQQIAKDFIDNGFLPYMLSRTEDQIKSFFQEGSRQEINAGCQFKGLKVYRGATLGVDEGERGMNAESRAFLSELLPVMLGEMGEVMKKLVSDIEGGIPWNRSGESDAMGTSIDFGIQMSARDFVDVQLSKPYNLRIVAWFDSEGNFEFMIGKV